MGATCRRERSFDQEGDVLNWSPIPLIASILLRQVQSTYDLQHLFLPPYAPFERIGFSGRLRVPTSPI